MCGLLQHDGHHTLEEQGVTNYDWAEFKDDIETTLIAMTANIIGMMTFMKPNTISKMSEGFQEKGEDFKKLFDNGIYAKFFLFVTSIYLSDKDRFMVVEQH